MCGNGLSAKASAAGEGRDEVRSRRRCSREGTEDIQARIGRLYRRESMAACASYSARGRTAVSVCPRSGYALQASITQRSMMSSFVTLMSMIAPVLTPIHLSGEFCPASPTSLRPVGMSTTRSSEAIPCFSASAQRLQHHSTYTPPSIHPPRYCTHSHNAHRRSIPAVLGRMPCETSSDTEF